MKKNPWAWQTLAEVSRSARLISGRLQAEEDRKAAKAAKAKPGSPSEASTVDTPAPASRPGRPRVKAVRKLPASYPNEIRRLLFGVRTAVGDWPDGELPALCDALHVMADDLAEGVETEGGDQ